MTVDAPTSEPAVARAPGPRRRPSLSLLGGLISLVSLGAVIWWASGQRAPRLPHTGAQWAAALGAAALYGIGTLVRGERWRRLLADEGGRPTRGDAHALNVVGYMGNNVLPARAGDAIRVLLMAPRATLPARSVVGTLVAERILDVGVLVVVFVVVGWGLLGEVGGRSVELIAGLGVAAAVAAFVGWRVVRRNARLHGFVAPIASATLRLRRAHHGLRLLAITLLIWTVEIATWMTVAAAVGFGMNPVEGAYLVALSSVFAMVPSGPAYAGTQDAAVVLGIKAIGGSGSVALAYLVMLRFVIVVPITVVGLGLLVTRYGGLRRLRAARSAAEG